MRDTLRHGPKLMTASEIGPCARRSASIGRRDALEAKGQFGKLERTNVTVGLGEEGRPISLSDPTIAVEGSDRIASPSTMRKQPSSKSRPHPGRLWHEPDRRESRNF